MNDAARDAMVEALARIAQRDRSGALAVCDRAMAADPDARLPVALRRYLEPGASDSSESRADKLYREPTAFEAFIDGGDNPALYAATIRSLRHLDPNPPSVLDIGCGDGRVTRATIGPATTRVHLVEPSMTMLTAAVGAVESAGGHDRTVSTTNDGVETLLSRNEGANWQRAQATFALHTLPPERRHFVLAWLTERVESMALVEFDVPEFDDGSAEHARYAVDRYERGLAEYDSSEPVTTGFLMPVLVGQFNPAAPRHTWEQPVAEWCRDLTDAGFEAVTHTRIHDYWWAPAHLVTGNGRYQGR